MIKDINEYNKGNVLVICRVREEKEVSIIEERGEEAGGDKGWQVQMHQQRVQKGLFIGGEQCIGLWVS